MSIQGRIEQCSACSMSRAYLGGNRIHCLAAGKLIDVSHERCRLRKWSSDSIDATNNTCVNAPALIVIATGRYHSFVPELLASARSFFFTDQQATLYVFSDTRVLDKDVVWVPTPHAPWPGPTLRRYHIMLKARHLLEQHDFLMYCDADMRMVGPVDCEIVGDLVAVRHAWLDGAPRASFTYETRPESSAYIADYEGDTYYTGAFQGGRMKHYLRSVEVMADAIDKDARRGITAIWHDESHWNRYLVDCPPEVTLDHRYYCPESWSLADRRVIGLNKDAGALRD